MAMAMATATKRVSAMAMATKRAMAIMMAMAMATKRAMTMAWPPDDSKITCSSCFFHACTL